MGTYLIAYCVGVSISKLHLRFLECAGVVLRKRTDGVAKYRLIPRNIIRITLQAGMSIVSTGLTRN